jgi:hypothetical protein
MAWGVSNEKVADALGALTIGSEVLDSKTEDFAVAFAPQQ